MTQPLTMTAKMEQRCRDRYGKHCADGFVCLCTECELYRVLINTRARLAEVERDWETECKLKSRYLSALCRVRMQMRQELPTGSILCRCCGAIWEAGKGHPENDCALRSNEADDDLPQRLADVERQRDGLRETMRQIESRTCIAGYDSGDSGVNRLARAALAACEPATDRPTIVCLCGSTRFYQQFQEANYRETMAGRIVLSVGFCPHAQEIAHGEEKGCAPEQKIALDELYKRKIDLADEVLILDVDGYIGSSTRSELEYAKLKGKRVRFLSAECEPATQQEGDVSDGYGRSSLKIEGA